MQQDTDHTTEKGGNYCENASVRTMDSDQTRKQKASLSRASASRQRFKLYIRVQLSEKWQTVAARLNMRQDKIPHAAKYPCKASMFL